MLSLINLQLKLLSRTTMKRTIFSIMTAALAVSAILVSCEPMEPSTREDTFYRIASVSYKDGDASLLLDYTFCHKSGVICISEVIDSPPGNLDSSLCFLQPSVFLDVLCV